MSRNPWMQVAVSALVIGLATSGCSSLGLSEFGHGSANKHMAQSAKSAKQGDHTKAIEYAEAAVVASPQNADLRASLGQQYMAAGRFASAEASFAEALALQDTPRTALNLALAKIANGRTGDAVMLIDKYREQLPASDYGFALALAGEIERGTLILGDAVRQNDATARTRQNLAFVLAMQGRWLEAKIIAAQDMPYANVGDRMGQWATFMQAGSPRVLIAGVLNSDATAADPGMPTRLALNTNPADFAPQMVASAPSSGYDPAPLAQYAPPPVDAATAAAAVEAVPAATQAPVESVVTANQQAQVMTPIEAPEEPYKVSVQLQKPTPAPVKTASIAPATKVTNQSEAAALVAKARKSSGLAVQLGAYSSMASAKSAWKTLSARHATLRAYTPSYASVTVKGRNYVRLAANGIADKRVGWALCRRVNGSATVCAQRQISNTQLQMAERAKAAPAANSKQAIASR